MAGDGWTSSTIGQVADVTDYVANGSFASLKSNVTYRDEPSHAILVRLVDHNNGWNGPFVYVDKKSYDFLRKSSLRPGDVIIANVGANAGTVFKVADLAYPMTLGPNAVLVLPRENIANRDFVYYYLSSSTGQQQLASITSGSAQPKFNKTDLRKLTIDLPTLPEQRRIAAILGALDDKIEMNRGMNRTLEKMAQAIFRSWFIDFDCYDDLVDSELGPIPRGWEVGSLSQLAELQTVSINPGGSPEKVWEHYSIPAFDEGRNPSADLGETIKSNKYRVVATAILVSKLNPQFPRVWMPDVQEADAAVCSTEFMPFVPKLSSWRSFLFELVRSDAMQASIQSRVTGTTGSRQRVKPSDIAETKIILPPPDVIESAVSVLMPLHSRLLNNVRESRTLATLRDALLPMLISGELRVPEAVNTVEGEA